MIMSAFDYKGMLVMDILEHYKILDAPGCMPFLHSVKYSVIDDS